MARSKNETPIGAASKDEVVASLLRERILNGLTLGVLRAGERLPGVRTLALDFGVGARAVLSACRILEEEQLIERRDRSGMYVAANVSLHAAGESSHSEWLAAVLIEGLKRGFPAPALASQLHDVFGERRFRALVADSNDDQLWSLADELVRDYGVEPVSLDLDLLALGNEFPDPLIPIDVVITTSFQTDSVKALAKRLGAPVLSLTMCTGLFSEVRRQLVRKPVYFVVSDPRMARKLSTIFATADGAENLRTVVQGREDVDAIPEAAPVYITRLTRTKMQGSPLLDRCLPEERVFSTESARELLALVVGKRMRNSFTQTMKGAAIAST
ncbi:MAG: GntR family transcriptional regulator [Gemmatimonadaceae bacterium]|nr:GntR family transcriptional regulator [Gemmatimonadaceae bacterium]